MRVRNRPSLGRLGTALLLLALVAAFGMPPSAAATPAAAPASSGLRSALAAAHLVTHITYARSSPNILRLNEYLDLTWNYQTSEPGGVRIFARPFTNGALTPNYGASGSPLYPTGSGAGSGSFTIMAGPVVVDQIRFQMYNADQSRLLFEGFVPVYYRFEGGAHGVYDISLSPATPNILANDGNVTVNFSYVTDNPGGVRIFARPFTGNSGSPGYGASPSPLYATGSGAGSGTFTILTGSIDVDHIRFQILNDAQTVLLYEAFIPVSYAFRPGSNIVTNVTLSPATPNILDHNQDITVNFNYTTINAGGVRIFARPFTHGQLSPNYAASGSPLYPTGSGAGSGAITISSGPVIVDAIRFTVLNADQSVVLFETLAPVHYQFGAVYQIHVPIVMR